MTNDNKKDDASVKRELDEVQRHLFLTRYRNTLENWFRMHPRVPPPVYRDKDGNYLWVFRQSKQEQ